MTTIEIIMLPVTDQQKAKAFYTKLGFQVIVEAPMEHGQTWLQMGLPGQTTSIALIGVQGVVVQTDDIEQEIQELKAKGIEAGKVDQQPWGKFSWIKDPDGNGICLHQR